MERYAEAKRQNRLFEQEREECKVRLAALAQLKQESKDLEGTDAWRELLADYEEVAAACAAHLKDGDG